MIRPSMTSPLADADAATLTRRFREALRRYFQRKLGDPAEAEDMAQEVLLRLTRRQQTLERSGDRPKTQTAYIFAVARSVFADKLRRDAVRERSAHCELVDALDIEVPSAERVYSAQERIERVSQLMQGLSPRAREVFMMHRVQGFSYSEIAGVLSIAVSTVEKHMIAALRFLVQHAAEFES